MSTVTEIEEAIRSLSPQERELLEARLFSERFGLTALKEDELEQLLSSLDEAEKEIDAGQGLSADDLRKAVRSWVAG